MALLRGSLALSHGRDSTFLPQGWGREKPPPTLFAHLSDAVLYTVGLSSALSGLCHGGSGAWLRPCPRRTWGPGETSPSQDRDGCAGNLAQQNPPFLLVSFGFWLVGFGFCFLSLLNVACFPFCWSWAVARSRVRPLLGSVHLPRARGSLFTIACTDFSRSSLRAAGQPLPAPSLWQQGSRSQEKGLWAG